MNCELGVYMCTVTWPKCIKSFSLNNMRLLYVRVSEGDRWVVNALKMNRTTLPRCLDTAYLGTHLGPQKYRQAPKQHAVLFRSLRRLLRISDGQKQMDKKMVAPHCHEWLDIPGQNI